MDQLALLYMDADCCQWAGIYRRVWVQKDCKKTRLQQTCVAGVFNCST
jgi:hypothetical protein